MDVSMSVEKKRRPPARKAKPKAKAKPRPARKKSADKPSRQLPALTGLVVLVLIVVLAGLLARMYFPGQHTETVQTVPETAYYDAPKFEVYHEEALEKPAATAAASQASGLPSDALPMACIIIDDIGYDSPLAEKFLALDVPLTFSILPFSPHREKIIAAAGEKDVEIMLHLPMEPEQYPQTDPGPGALLTSMSPDDLIRQLKEDIDSVPGAVGVNNHMGSKMTTVSSQMYQILSILKRDGLFFIDSRTTVNTLCKPSARLLQVPFAERDIFLDHLTTAAFVRQQIEKLIETSKQEGRAIGIGHPHDVTYEVLREMLPELKRQVRLVPASQLVKILG